MLENANMPDAMLAHCADPFVGNWDIEQGSQLELKLGDKSHYYFLFRDRRTGRIILQAGRSRPRFFAMHPECSMYELFMLNHGDKDYDAGVNDHILIMSVGRQFREGHHASIDITTKN